MDKNRNLFPLFHSLPTIHRLFGVRSKKLRYAESVDDQKLGQGFQSYIRPAVLDASVSHPGKFVIECEGLIALVTLLGTRFLAVPRTSFQVLPIRRFGISSSFTKGKLKTNTLTLLNQF